MASKGGISINIIGINTTQAFLQNKNNNSSKAANEAVKKAAFYIEDEVKESIAGKRAEHVSVDTGRFLSSVKAEQKQLLTATISSNVEYAKHLEYGTSRIAPRKHFGNTKTRNEKKISEFIEAEIKKI